MTTTAKNQPIDTIRDGALKAVIWKNESGKGPFYSAELSRTYKQGDGFRDSSSFSGAQLLRIACLAQIAYDEIAHHRAAEGPES